MIWVVISILVAIIVVVLGAMAIYETTRSAAHGDSTDATHGVSQSNQLNNHPKTSN